MKTVDNGILDTAAYECFCENRDKRRTYTGTPIICEKALQYNGELSGEILTLKVSSGWLAKFKSRHDIRRLNMSDEKPAKKWRRNC